MFRFIISLVVSVLAICSASAVSSYDEMWSKQFVSKINVLPKPSGNCSVCFYEQKNFAGPKFCVGKRAKGCLKANPIMAPGTIESIKFGKGCDLVVSVRVTEMPYNEHVTVISTDVASTGYNLTTSQYSVQEVYVEEAGQACFLGIPKSGKGYGTCYSKNVPVVEDAYRNSFTELMLFKTAKKNFNVIAYENDYYNSPEQTPMQNDVNSPEQTFMQNDVNTLGLEQRFSGYSKILETNQIDPASGMNNTMQYKVRSIKFVSLEKDFSATPGIVIPASY